MEWNDWVTAWELSCQTSSTHHKRFAKQEAPGRQKLPASGELETSASCIDNILVTAQGSLCHRSGAPQQKEPLITGEGKRNCLEMKPL